MNRLLRNKRNSKTPSRRQAKASWIQQANKFRLHPEGMVSKEIFCEAWCYGQRRFSVVHFEFFHSKLRRFFSVRVSTAVALAYAEVEDSVERRLNAEHPLPSPFIPVELARRTSGVVLGQKTALSQEFIAACAVRRNIKKPMLLAAADMKKKLDLRAEVTHDNGVCARIQVLADTDVIDDQFMREFVARFRSCGEPFVPGVVWDDGVVEVSPLEHAQSMLSNRETVE